MSDSNDTPPEGVEDNIVGVIRDPHTTVSYFAAVSKEGETVGYTMPNGSGDVVSHDDNVALTAAALLDGFERNHAADSSISPGDFLEQVIETAKVMKNQSRTAHPTEGHVDE